MQAILAQWEAFAACMPAATNMTPMGLRDHAQQILEAVVKDLSTSQARDAQSAKSMHGSSNRETWSCTQK
jgi:hypothetical protein